MEAVSIYAVVVLYRCLPLESSTVRTLLNALSQVQSDALRIHILLYDNTPDRTTAEFPEGVEYHPAGNNNGLAEAYNFASSRARGLGFEWLLTLDQDSHLPENFLTAAIPRLQGLRNLPYVSALVPHILYKGKVLSPYRSVLGGTQARYFPLGFQGIPDDAVFALNSASILRLSALRQAGDYDLRFWLDASDTSVFHRLAERGKRVCIAGEIRVEHDFAMKDRQRQIPPERYRSIVEAESAFSDLYLGWPASLSCTARLVARFLYYFMSGNQPLRIISGEIFGLRLFRSRRYRLQRWQSPQSQGISRSAVTVTTRSRISVCMATYNGESYVEEQIRSILPQLGKDDEIIIVDDGSSDQTLERIAYIRDSRIRVIEHAQNSGVVQSFEDAIRCATGDIIFLSDMDDVWSPHKVSRISQVFRDRPDVMIVTTAVDLIDERGDRIDKSASLHQACFKPGLMANLIRNRYQGSAMAFRANLLPVILPIPHDRLFFHDHWIGLQNALHGGRAVFLDEPLIHYRRHRGNLSRTMSRSGQLALRLQLGWELAKSLTRLRRIAATRQEGRV